MSKIFSLCLATYTDDGTNILKQACLFFFLVIDYYGRTMRKTVPFHYRKDLLFEDGHRQPPIYCVHLKCEGLIYKI